MAAGDRWERARAPVVLVGFMAAGKTTAGRILASLTGREFLDLDDLIALGSGRPVPDIIRTSGEARFRGLEARALAAACRTSGTVIATGGGAVMAAANRRTLARAGCRVVWLKVSPAEVLRRAGRTSDRSDAPTPGHGAGRPLLPPTVEEVGRLLAAREEGYRDAATLEVSTEGRSAEAVARELAVLLELPGGRSAVAPGHGTEFARVDGGPPDHGPVVVGRGLLGGLASLPGFPGDGLTRVFLAGDPLALALYGGRVVRSLRQAGMEVDVEALPPGEGAKRAGVLARLWESMALRGLGRGDLVLSLGGGAASDLAGFAAATYMRGVPVAHVPTTLLAQVDAAVGGKTAINLSRGKNLAGVYHFPSLVAADLDTLGTLPPDLVAEGTVELAKTLLVGGTSVREARALALTAHRVLLAGDAPAAGHPSGVPGDDPVAAAVGKAVAAKLGTVAEDPRDRGRRMALNLGHTFGHALEAASRFRGRHGLSVAVGMLAAARLSEGRGCLAGEALQAVVSLAEDLIGLFPARDLGRLGRLEAREVQSWMAADKKRAGRDLVFVLLRGTGDGMVEPFTAKGVTGAEAAGALGLTLARVRHLKEGRE
ncbi:MAG: hypothetical protein C4551_07470 [Bacillota bacterium]|nr:MAG: hypothetical protein C4551_07470 [Bacillota bacterium]